MSRKQKLVLLGATGSIGDSSLKVIRKHRDRIELVGIAANANAQKLGEIAKEFDVPHVTLFDDDARLSAIADNRFEDRILHSPGEEGLCELARLPDADIVLVAVVGTQGLMPALAALESKKTLAVASKEILVLAGKFIIDMARRHDCAILPVDSEHNAIFQCIDGTERSHIEKIILTASGGSLRDAPIESLKDVTLEKALAHPNWDMGPKVTLDSATMANKGLEMIEARWLFGLEPPQVDVVVHPQSIVHSMAQFVDGSVLAQLCPPDMTFAIQHCLLYPDRAEGVAPTLDFSHAFNLEFTPPESERYPCLGLARSAMEACGIAPGVFNAANEIAVDAFVSGKIPFVDIPRIIEKTLESTENVEPDSISEVLRHEKAARHFAATLIQER